MKKKIISVVVLLFIMSLALSIPVQASGYVFYKDAFVLKPGEVMFDLNISEFAGNTNYKLVIECQTANLEILLYCSGQWYELYQVNSTHYEIRFTVEPSGATFLYYIRNYNSSNNTIYKTYIEAA